MWYWEGNGRLDWRNRAAAAGTRFRVSYSNGTIRQYTLQELEQKPEVWRNDNTVANFTGQAGNRPGTRESRAFAIRGVRNPWHDDNPQIEFYYRGWRRALPVTVFAVLNNLTVDHEWTGPREINLRNVGRWDNDRWEEGTETITNAVDFANTLTVTAHWVTRRTPVVEGPIVLTYNHDIARAASATDNTTHTRDSAFWGSPSAASGISTPSGVFQPPPLTGGTPPELLNDWWSIFQAPTAWTLNTAPDAALVFPPPAVPPPPPPPLPMGNLPRTQIGRFYTMDFGAASGSDHSGLRPGNPALGVNTTNAGVWANGWGIIAAASARRDIYEGEPTRIRIWYYTPRSNWDFYQNAFADVPPRLPIPNTWDEDRDFMGNLSNSGIDNSRSAETGIVVFRNIPADS
jgi:hypothetical protein